MQKNLLFVVLSLFIFSVTDCNREKVDVTYTKDIQPIVVSHCAGCHNCANYSSTKTLLKKPTLLGRIKHKIGYRGMPQSYKLPDAEIEKICCWIKANYPQ